MTMDSLGKDGREDHLSGNALLLIATFGSLLSLFISLMGFVRIGVTIIGLVGLFQVMGEARRKQPEKHWALLSMVFIVAFLVTGGIIASSM